MATATKNKDATATLLELEAERDRLREELRTRRREHHAAATETRNLNDQRRRLVDREPGLIDHLGRPLTDIKDNPVATIDAELKKLANVDEMYAKVEHLTRLEAIADQHVRCSSSSTGPRSWPA